MSKKQKTLDEQIDKLELDELDGNQIEKVVSSMSQEGMTMRRRRKGVRYQLFRIQTEFNGGPAANVDGDFKKHFEEHPNFEGWRFFGITWDVALDDPYHVVHRDKSIDQEWNEIMESKFPRLEPGGKVTYPDIKVRKRVEQHQKEKAAKGKK